MTYPVPANLSNIRRQPRLTIQQIIDAFPRECRTIASREAVRLRRIIRDYELNLQGVRNRHWDKFTEIFLLQIWSLYDPVPERRQLAALTSLIYAVDHPGQPQSHDNRLTDEDIARARERPITELYAFERPRRTGKRITALCPFHAEKTPSFVIYPNNTWHCFGCGAGGDAIEFIRRLNDLNFPQAVKFLIGQ